MKRITPLDAMNTRPVDSLRNGDHLEDVETDLNEDGACEVCLKHLCFFCSISPGMGKKSKMGWLQRCFKKKENLSEILLNFTSSFS